MSIPIPKHAYRVDFDETDPALAVSRPDFLETIKLLPLARRVVSAWIKQPCTACPSKSFFSSIFLCPLLFFVSFVALRVER